jgi:hypothetical protein
MDSGSVEQSRSCNEPEKELGFHQFIVITNNKTKVTKNNSIFFNKYTGFI